MRRHLARSLLTLVLVLSACDLGPDYRRPAVEVPDQFRATPVSGAEVWPTEGWWFGFHSDELNELIEQARTQNFDIAAAIARVRQADAQVRIAGAAMLPTLNASGNASWSHSSGSTSRVSSTTAAGVVSTGSRVGRPFDSHFYSLNLNTAYMVDFWERNLRFKTDSSDDGPKKGAPAIERAGMMGDRASVIFAAPEEISGFVSNQC